MPFADAASLDAITVDALGTLLELNDPVPALASALAERGEKRSLESVRAAFLTEAGYYRPRSLEGRDTASLSELRTSCVAIFLDSLEVGIDAASFVDPFIAAISFRPANGASEALDTVRGAGIVLACVANWDIGLHEHLAALSLDHHFQVVLTSAEAGAAKPDPSIFELALGRLGVEPSRALHVGDEEADRDGAEKAGLAFEPAPLATLPARIGL